MNYFALSPVFLKFTLLLAFSIGGNANAKYSQGYVDMRVFLFATVTSWIFVIAFFVLFSFNIERKISQNMDWNCPVITGFMLYATLSFIKNASFRPKTKDVEIN